MTPLTEAALLREVARVQHDKTLQQVRDLVDSIAVMEPKPGDRWGDRVERRAKSFRTDLIAGLQRLRNAEGER